MAKMLIIMRSVCFLMLAALGTKIKLGKRSERMHNPIVTGDNRSNILTLRGVLLGDGNANRFVKLDGGPPGDTNALQKVEQPSSKS